MDRSGREFLKRGTLLPVAVGLCILGLQALLPNASATEVRRGENAGIRSDETLNGDVFLFSRSARVDGTVEGDVYVLSQDFSVNGRIKGDVIGFAHSLRVNGDIDGNIRAVANNLTVTGRVSRNILTLGEILTFDHSGTLGGSLTAFVQNLDIEGRVGRNILLFARHGTISGLVNGQIDAKGDSLRLNSTAKVRGPVRFEGSHPPEVSTGAVLAFPVAYHELKHRLKYQENSFYISGTIWTAAFALFGLVLFSVIPQFLEESMQAATKWDASVGLGMLVLFAVPIAAVVACLTLIGLLVGVSTFGVWIALVACAKIVVAAIIGQWILGRTTGAWPLICRMAVGLVVMFLAESVPYVGWLVKLGALFLGVGAISLAFYRRFSPALSPNRKMSFAYPPLKFVPKR